MDKRSQYLLGAALVLLGVLSLTITGFTALLGISLGGIIWRFWPLTVMAVGLGLIVTPLLARGKRGLGALFIPGFPILTTGTLLLLASVFGVWGMWGWLWPMIVTSLAMGFLFAAVYERIVWLAIPGIIIGLNGLTFQFCAITGLWHWWAVLWTIEPLAVGLALLVAGVKEQIPGLRLAGFVLCGLAVAGLMLMITVLGAWWPLRLLGSGLIVLTGVAVLGWALLRPRLLPNSALE
jgi:hypothetical protein